MLTTAKASIGHARLVKGEGADPEAWQLVVRASSVADGLKGVTFKWNGSDCEVGQ